jgi:hypothetical protein
MVNLKDNKLFKYSDSPHKLWLEYAAFGAMYLCSIENDIDRLAWPTGDQAVEEERTERHRGLYWSDHRADDGKNVRLFLPNYFNTFRETLRLDYSYSYLLGGMGTVLDLMGKPTEAHKHFAEAEAFSPVG